MRRSGRLRRRLPRGRAGRAAALATLASSSSELARGRHAFPVCGPNCDGLVALHSRAALWGDALARRAGARRAGLAERQPRRQRARHPPRAPAAHRDLVRERDGASRTADWLAHLATEPEVRSVALLVEDAGDGARAVRGARRVRRRGDRRGGAEGRGVGGRRRRGRGPHRRARRRPARVPRARRARRARRGRTTSTTCSSSPRRSPSAAPARAGAGSGSSPARAATRGSARTRRSGSASSCPRSRRPPPRRSRSGCPPPPRSPTRSTTPR